VDDDELRIAVHRLRLGDQVRLTETLLAEVREELRGKDAGLWSPGQVGEREFRPWMIP
jgi:hypothetical protein